MINAAFHVAWCKAITLAMTFPVNQCTIIYSKYLRWFMTQSLHHSPVVQFKRWQDTHGATNTNGASERSQ
jgi:hypothetical protein